MQKLALGAFGTRLDARFYPDPEAVDPGVDATTGDPQGLRGEGNLAPICRDFFEDSRASRSFEGSFQGAVGAGGVVHRGEG